MAIRRLYCPACKPDPLDPEDVANHWHYRTVNIIAKKPPEHFITAGTKRTDLPTLLCDQCGQIIPDGHPAVAYTAWRGPTEPENWEAKYTA